VPPELSDLVFAFSAGTATFFSPCSFPLVPGYVSHYLGSTAAGDGASADGGTVLGRSAAGSTVASLGRALGVGLVVSVGMVLVYGGVAAVAITLGGRALADVALLELVVGVVFVAAGALMAAGWRPSVDSPVRLPRVTV
jgi:cytochrome c-type biogenesis protein